LEQFSFWKDSPRNPSRPPFSKGRRAFLVGLAKNTEIPPLKKESCKKLNCESKSQSCCPGGGKNLQAKIGGTLLMPMGLPEFRKGTPRKPELCPAKYK
jgi:hypothetical protein